MEKWFDLDRLSEMVTSYAPKVALALLTLVVGFWVIGRISKLISRIFERRGIDLSVGRFLSSFITIGLKVMLVISVASMFGIETAAFVGVIAAMAFAVGMALQGSLGNFASGIMILLFKPYKVGDLVEVQGYKGVVSAIEIFNTVLMQPDNKKVIIPNSAVTSGPIVNISGQGEIRVDMTFGIGYDDDIDKAKAIMHEVVQSCSKVLKDKPVDVFLSAMADSSVNFVVRPWAKSEHYWDVFFYVHEQVKKQFDQNDIGIPYPQMDVHFDEAMMSKMSS